MDISLPYYLTGGGLLLLFAGGEVLVRGGVGLSRFFGFSPLLIGLVVMSFGTSAPEFFITFRAVQGGHADLAVANIIGSCVANILLVLGFGALLRPMPTSPKVVFRDGGSMVAASVAFLVMAQTGSITKIFGYGLLGGLALFLVLSFAFDWRRPSPHSVFLAREATRPQTSGDLHPGVALFFLVLGALLLFFGSYFVINGSLAISRKWGFSESAIGLVVVALGTSLPEFFTMLSATMRGQAGLAVGNIVGSNIFNLLGVTGGVAALHPIMVSQNLARVDAVIMVGAAVMLVPLLNSSWRLSRPEGFLLLVCYAAYGALITFREGLLPLAAFGLT